MFTDNEHLIHAAKKHYNDFLVPTSFLEGTKLDRSYTADELADLDIKTSVNKIGEIINLSQELNTQLWNQLNSGASYSDVEDLYCDIAKLAILSGVEIDRAKKEFVIDSVKEIKRMKQKYHLVDDAGRKIKPNFFGHIARTKGYYDNKKKAYLRHQTAMDYLEKCVNRFQVRKKKLRNNYPFSCMLEFDGYRAEYVYRDQARRVIQMIRQTKSKIQNIWYDTGLDVDVKEKIALTYEVRNEAILYIDNAKINPHTMFWLVKQIENEKNSDIKRTMFNILFGAPSKDFFSLIKESKEHLTVLAEDPNGTIDLYGIKFKKLKKCDKLASKVS